MTVSLPAVALFAMLAAAALVALFWPRRGQ